MKTVQTFDVQVTALLDSKPAQEKLRQIFCFKIFLNCLKKIKPRIFFGILLRYCIFEYYCSLKVKKDFMGT